MRNHTIMALAAMAMMASQASAADLPRKAPMAPLPPPPPPYVWTGCYIGGNVGGASAHVDVTNVFTGGSGSGSSEASIAGGQIGCDYQFYNSWVVGIRNMFDGTDIHRSRNFADPVNGGFGSVETRVKWFDALNGTPRLSRCTELVDLRARRRRVDKRGSDSLQQSRRANWINLRQQPHGLDSRSRRRMDVHTALVAVC